MFVMKLYSDPQKRYIRLCSTDYKDLLDEIIDEVPKDIYKRVKEFVLNSQIGDDLRLRDRYGRIVAVDAENLYNRYQLKWMRDHGYSISDMITALSNTAKEMERSHPHSLSHSLKYVFNEWALEDGFNGEIWACYEEWLDNELFEMFDM